MIIEVKGDLFTSKALILAHGVNCKGSQGAGIALEFKKRFPAAYSQYHQKCLEGNLKPGQGLLYTKGSPMIASLATQWGYGRGSLTPHANISWIYDACDRLAFLCRMKDYARVVGLPVIAMPRLGCGLGGLEWKIVKPCIEAAFSSFDGIVEVWSL